MASGPHHHARRQHGSALALVVIVALILTITGAALLSVAEGQLFQSIRVKHQEAAFSAAEAAFEKAIYWMSQQVDMLEALEEEQASDSLTFDKSRADYEVSFSRFLAARPVFHVEAVGYSGIFEHRLSAYVVQAVSGWELAMCRCPIGPNNTAELRFVTGDILDIPMHVNAYEPLPNTRDIYIQGSPEFRSHVSVSESRYTSGGADKYGSVMNLFQGGISFNQPASLISDADSVGTRVNRFREATNPSFRFSPQVVQSLPFDSSGREGFHNTVSEQPAVHLQFYVNNGQGYVRIHDNVTVAAYTRGGSSGNSLDYKINPESNSAFKKYGIYGCHFITGDYTDVRIDDPDSPLYVSQVFGGVESEPGAQIYVDGNVVIGAAEEDMAHLGEHINRVKGQISVVASGNIWITNDLKVDGPRREDGMPTIDNPNILGLISQGVIKLADPGMTDNGLLYQTDGYWEGPEEDQTWVEPFDPTQVDGYKPIANPDQAGVIHSRKLPQTVTVEAAMTVGGGGWGVENLYRNSSFPGRKNYSPNQKDTLIVRGSLTEALRGAIGSGNNGFIRGYYYDERVMAGIVPGNMWLKGKYVPIPGGWSESSSIRGIHQN